MPPEAFTVTLPLLLPLQLGLVPEQLAVTFVASVSDILQVAWHWLESVTVTV